MPKIKCERCGAHVQKNRIEAHIRRRHDPHRQEVYVYRGFILRRTGNGSVLLNHKGAVTTDERGVLVPSDATTFKTEEDARLGIDNYLASKA